MTEQDFNELAAKVLAGEASAEESARLDELVARDVKWRKHYDELRQARQFIRRLGPIVEAMDAPPRSVPEHRLAELQDVLHQRRKASQARQTDSGSWLSGIWMWLNRHTLAAGSLAVLLLLCVLFLYQENRPRDVSAPGNVAYLLSTHGNVEVQRDGKGIAAQTAVALNNGDQIVLQAGATAKLLTARGAEEYKGPNRIKIAKAQSDIAHAVRPKSAGSMQAVLFKPVQQVLGMKLLATMRSRSQTIPLYSPADATRYTSPLILWKSEPGKRYDISIYDEFDTSVQPLQTTNVTSPVSFSSVPAWNGRTLQPGGLYRLYIHESDNPRSGSESTWRVLPDASHTNAHTGVGNLDRAVRHLTSEPQTVGDALVELLTLPPDVAESELALRLKLAAFAQLGFKEDYDKTAAMLAQMGK